MRLGVAAAMVDGALVPGDVAVEDGVIAHLGAAPAGPRGLAAPGFIDLQVNGFAGVDFLSAAAEDFAAVAEPLASSGVTAYQPTFITSPVDAYWTPLKTVAAIEDAVPRILGVHLEGPFISPRWHGAHNVDYILRPDLSLADRLCSAGPVTYVTLAPEMPGGLDLVKRLVGRGIVVACGHTDADASAAGAAYDAGARAITHIYNAQRRWKPRDPGVAGVALTRSDVVVQAIVDHVHLAPETAAATWLTAGVRFCLVTDAMAAAGLAEGTYRLGDRVVRVEGDVARLENGTLAGSVLTMDRAVRNLVGVGAPVEAALSAATSVPAELVGRTDLGRLREGLPADVVVLDDALEVTRTLVNGRAVYER